MDDFIDENKEEDSESNKKVQITGTTTRYQMKKVLKIVNIPQKINIQPTIINKLNGYKQQDKKRNIFNPEKFITVETIIKMMDECCMNCYYCKEKMKIEYSMRREMDQWTLDRIVNNIGHNVDNVIIACLKCNLKRRNMRKDLFLSSTQMTLIKVV